MRHRREKGGPRSSYALLLDPTFGPFFWGRLVSTCGIWMHNILAAIVAFEITGSALMVGLVSVVQFAPQIALAPLSGQLADRGRALTQIVTGRVITGLGSLSLAATIAWYGGVGSVPSVTPVLLASAVTGLGFVTGGPAMQTLVPSLVKPDELSAAMALNSLPMTTARALGPTAGAATAAGLGPATAFALAACANFFFAVQLLRLRLPGKGAIRKPGADYRIRTGFRLVHRDRVLVALMVATAAIGVGADPAITLTPAIAEQAHGGSSLVGWLASAFGIGAAVAFFGYAPMVRTRGQHFTLLAGLVLMVAGLLLAAFSPGAAVSLLSFGVAGAGMSFAFTASTTELQVRVPEEFRGRVMAIWYMTFLGSRPVAAACNGGIADGLGLRFALCATAAIVFAAAGMCWAVGLGRREQV